MTQEPPALVELLTEEEVAARLSQEEGRRVTVQEVRAIIWRALPKIRQALELRGIESAEDLVPNDRPIDRNIY